MAVAVGSLEETARKLWLAGAARVKFGRCDGCGRVRDQNDKPLLVARQERARRFLCLECWDVDG